MGISSVCSTRVYTLPFAAPPEVAAMFPPQIEDACSVQLYAFTFGLTITGLISLFGHISGAHFSPPITVALMSIGEVEPVKMVLYVAAQIVGGIAGSGLAWGLLPLASQFTIPSTGNKLPKDFSSLRNGQRSFD